LGKNVDVEGTVIVPLTHASVTDPLAYPISPPRRAIAFAPEQVILPDAELRDTEPEVSATSIPA
jgi:hypothetical protein